MAVLIAVGGLAIAWENAVALAVLPALAATTASGIGSLRDRPRRTLLTAGAALLVPIGWLVLDHLWYLGHPVALTAKNVNTRLQLSVLGTNLSHPGRLFGFYEPQLWQRPAVVIAAIAVLLILAVVASFVTRRTAPAVAALTFLLVLLIILSVRDTLDVHPDLYRSGSRFLLPMPIGLWVVLHFSLAAARDRPRARTVIAAGVQGCRCRRSPCWQLRAWSSPRRGFSGQVRTLAAADAGAHPVIVPVNPDALLTECAGLKRIYRDARALLLVTYQRNAAYRCTAHDDLNAVDSDYERRGWPLQAAATHPVSRILIQGWTCQSISPQAGTCRLEGAGTVLLLTPPVSAR